MVLDVVWVLPMSVRLTRYRRRFVFVIGGASLHVRNSLCMILPSKNRASASAGRATCSWNSVAHTSSYLCDSSEQRAVRISFCMILPSKNRASASAGRAKCSWNSVAHTSSYLCDSSEQTAVRTETYRNVHCSCFFWFRYWHGVPWDLCFLFHDRRRVPWDFWFLFHYRA